MKTNLENRSFSLRYFTLTFRKKNRDAAAIAFHVVFFFFYRVLLKMFFQTTPSLFRWFVFFFVICFASNWSMVLLSTNWLLQKQKNKQTSMRRRTGETKITNLYTPLAELPSPLELSKIKNILLLHRVCNPFWGFLRATVFFSGKRYGWSLAMFRRAPMRHQSFWIPTNMLSPIRSGGEKLTSP